MTGLQAQGESIDQLQRRLENMPRDTSRVVLLCDLAWEMRLRPSDSAEHYLQSALLLAQDLNFKRGLGMAYVQLGGIYLLRDRLEEAKYALEQGLSYRQMLRDTAGVASVNNNLGDLHYQRGDLHEAERRFKRAMSLYIQRKDTMGVALVLGQLSELYSDRGEFINSQQCALRSLRFLEGMAKPDTNEIGRTLVTLGTSYYKAGLNSSAMDQYERARGYFEANGNETELANVLNNLGCVAEAEHDYVNANKYYRDSYARSVVQADTQGAVTNLRNIARIYRWLDQYDRALAEIQEAQELLGRSTNQMLVSTLTADRAELYLWKGEPDTAMALLRDMLPRIDSVSGPSLRIHFRHILSNAAAGLEDWAAAARWSREAQELQREQEMEVHGGTYMYGRYLEAKNASDKEMAQNELLKRDLENATLRTMLLWATVIALLVILVVALLAGWQRLKLLENRRKEAETRLALEVKEREVEQQRRELDMLEQAKRLEVLQVTMEVEDRERSRIARDLHDRVGADIAAFKILFGQLRDDLVATNPTMAQPLDKLNHGLHDLMSEVRAVSHDLESPTLKQFGLVAALKGFKEMFADATALEIELDVHGLDTRLDAKWERHIYLILKEMFNNAMRQGHASAFSIQLVREEDNLTIVVEDNGVGFNVHDPQFRMGLGLTSIHNRVQIMGGTIVLDSQVGRGTIITIEIPISTIPS